MRAFALSLLVCVCSAGACAQDRPLTDQERTLLVKQFEGALAIFDGATRGLTTEQAKFKESPERWSILEIAEHLSATEDFLFGYATKQVLAAPAKPEIAARTPDQVLEADRKMLLAIVDRSKKAQAPEPAKPSNRYATLEAASSALHEKRARVVEYVKTTQDSLRSHGTVTPDGRVTDAYQYLLMLAAHVERHTLQIDQVKSAAGFPK